MKILLVEDEQRVASFIKKGLEEQSYQVEVAYDGYIGKQLTLQNTFDLLILDVNLPGINGINLCRQLRQEGVAIPILMLTALGTTEDVVTGLDAGADDYLVKPFQFRELLARLNALMRRNNNFMQGRIYKLANLEVDVLAKTVKRNEEEIALTAREFGLLEFLIKNQGRVLSRVEIVEKVWEDSFDRGTNVLDVYINYLRKKIDKDFEPKLIHTVVGMGYVMREEQ